MRTKTGLVISLLLLLPGLAGCVASPSGTAAAADLAPQFVTADHVEVNQATVAKVTHVQGQFTYQDLRVLVDGVPLRFGSQASYAAGTFGVAGVSDATQAPALGDRITIPSAGYVTVAFLDIATGQVLWRYNASVPDATAPSAPLPTSPADHATGVSSTPTLAWTASQDPSGVTYELQVSLDPTFAAPVTTMTQGHIADTRYTLTTGQALQPGQTYYWRVRALDGAGNVGDWSTAVSFAVSPTG